MFVCRSAHGWDYFFLCEVYSLLVESLILCAASCCVMTLVVY